jgi:GMP synthase-like glutamine amidotransferase
MVLYVAMSATEEDYRAAGWWLQHQRVFEKASGRPCLVHWYAEVTPEFVARWPFSSIVVSGFGKSFEEFDLAALYGLNDVLRGTTLPVLGLCGGHQLLAHVFGGDLRERGKLEDEPIRRLAEGEADMYPEYHAGWYKEKGMQPVRVIEREDPLFAELPETLMVLESHYCEVKALPPEFVLLATNDNCRVQAMRHRERPVYGTQFHPEGYTDDYPHGRTILENFFRLAEGTR